MKRRLYLLPLLAAAAFAANACSSSTTPPATSLPISGDWAGNTSGLSLSLKLIDSKGTVTGSGVLTIDTISVALTVSQGVHVKTDVLLVLGATGYQDTNFSGVLSSKTQMAGTLNGSGFNSFNLNLAKQ